MGEGRSPFVRLFSDVASRVDDPFLARAVALAERGRGSTAPNPLVGCVIVSRRPHRRRGLPPARRRPARRGGRASRSGRRGARCRRLRDARAVRAPRQDPAVRRRAHRRRRRAGRHRHARPEPEARRTARERLRDAGVEVRVRRGPRAVRGAQLEGWLHRIATRRAVRDGEGRRCRSTRTRRFGPASVRPSPGASGAEVTRRLRSRRGRRARVGCDRDRRRPRADGARRRGRASPSGSRCGSSSSRRRCRPPMRACSPTGSPRPRCWSSAPARRRRLRPFAGRVDVLRADGSRPGRCTAGARRAGCRRACSIEPGPRLLHVQLGTPGSLDQLVIVTAGGMRGSRRAAAVPWDADRERRRARRPHDAARSGYRRRRVVTVVATCRVAAREE